MLKPRLPRRSIDAADFPKIAGNPFSLWQGLTADTRARPPPREARRMSPSGNVLSQKLRHGGLARSPLADTELLGETFARGVEDRLRLMVKTVIGTTAGAVRVAKLADAIRTVSGPAILGLVDVEDADTPGLIAIEPDLAYHLVDLTLGGDPVQAPHPAGAPLHRHRHGALPAAPRRHPRRLRACHRRQPRPAAHQGADDPRPAPEPLAAPPRARLHRRHGLRHGAHPRRGRPARRASPWSCRSRRST